MTIKIKITREIIEDLSDEQIDELVYNKASDKYFETFDETFQNTESDRILKQLFACSVLNIEVCNGGFDKFFSSNENLTEFALDGLMKIGATKHYELLKKAEKIFVAQKTKFSGIRNPNLDELDNQYYELGEIHVSRKNFIINNLEIFFD